MFEQVRKSLANYQEVYLTGEALQFNQEKIKVKFKGFFYRFENFSEVIKVSDYPKNWEILTEESHDEPHIIIHHFYSNTMKNDGFKLNAKKVHNITIETSNLRGLKYAIKALEKCVLSLENTIIVILTEINHQPSFEVRGIIEGFYGDPWSFEDRKSVIKYLSDRQMNTYMYAPKDDEFQRNRWREEYPQVKLKKFKALIEQAKDEQIDFYYMISPGNDIQYTKESEINALTDKLQQLIDLGVKCFGLLLDDIDYILKGEVARKFSHAGNAHAYLINKVNFFLKTQLEEYVLVACPTEYDNRYSSVYLEQLTAKTDPEVIFFWTGPSTLASEIRMEDIEKISKVYQRPMIIWDNVPVNDYLTDKETIFLTPYENRSSKLNEEKHKLVGIVSNPMFQWSLSTFMIDTMSDYLWNSEKYDPQLSLDKHLIDRYGIKHVNQLKKVISAYPNYYMREKLDPILMYQIKEKQIGLLTEYMEEVLAAHKLLLTIDNNESLQCQFRPFLSRVKHDYNLWEAICRENESDMHKLYNETKHYQQRVGRDIVSEYIKIHNLMQNNDSE